MIVVVSGLPRSGTSMMMQMLQAGGMVLLTDHRREADTNNPQGYWEYEAVKRLKHDQTWLGDAEGKVVKVIAPLVAYLPPAYPYKIIFMERDLEEVLQSQGRMLERLGQHYSADDQSTLKRAFTQELKQVNAWLADQPNIETLYVSYRAIILDPCAVAEQVSAFLDRKLNTEQMAAVVDAKLYREKRE
jgi:hypothetical protein